MSEYKYAALVREIIDGFPPLTPGQRARIAILLRGVTPAPADETEVINDVAA